MGNTLLNDDAIGIIVVRYLQSRLENFCDIDFKETSWGGFRIIDLLRGYDYCIILDSIKTGQSNIGFIHHLKTSDLLPTLRLNSYHDINFITALKLAETLNEKMPEDIDIFAVEVIDTLTITENLTAAVSDSIFECSKKVVETLIDKNLLDNKFELPKEDKIISEEDLRQLYSEKDVA
jgi:hydrogenase maturation protease